MKMFCFGFATCAVMVGAWFVFRPLNTEERRRALFIALNEMAHESARRAKGGSRL